MITKEQVEAAEKRIADAEEAIAEDKRLVCEYNEQVCRNMYLELAEILTRSGFIDYPNLLVDRVELNQPASQPLSDVRQFDVVLHCISFR